MSDDYDVTVTFTATEAKALLKILEQHAKGNGRQNTRAVLEGTDQLRMGLESARIKHNDFADIWPRVSIGRFFRQAQEIVRRGRLATAGELELAALVRQHEANLKAFEWQQGPPPLREQIAFYRRRLKLWWKYPPHPT